ncbi:hypothetical protein E3G67_003714 [Mycobacteroides abscessus]|nr:hypothetical protein [Mycobacteroides abscessus]
MGELNGQAASIALVVSTSVQAEKGRMNALIGRTPAEDAV